MANKSKARSLISLRYRQFGIISVLVAMVGTSLYFANTLLQRAQDLSAGATAGTASIFFDPVSLSIPTSGLTSVWVTTDKPMAFVSTELSFDPTKLSLTAEPSLENSALSKGPSWTTMAQANASGVIKLSALYGGTGDALSQAPSGSFKLATLVFDKKITTPNILTTISATTSTTQIVDDTTTPFVVTTTPASITLNPVASPSPSPIPDPTVAPTITPATAAPTPHTTTAPSTPKPTTGDIKPPTLTLSTERIFWTFVTAGATDSSGIQSIAMKINGKLQKTCTGATKCKLGWYAKRGTVYNVEVTATDKSAGHNQTTKRLTVK